MKLKAGGKAILVTLVAAVAGYSFYWANQNGYLSNKQAIPSSIPEQRYNLPTASNMPATTVVNNSMTQVALTGSTNGQRVKYLTIPWNGTLGLMYANGGASTTNGSLMDKYGIKLDIERQDDYSQITAALIQFAQSNGQSGAAFATIMGDAYPAFAATTNDQLAKIGHSIEVVGAIGYSRGEDKCMLPADVKQDAQKARGSLIGGVLRDGDVHICMLWAADNAIPVNPDEKTYDPNAMNFVSVSSFTEADEKLITGYCENRDVVNNGQRTGDKAKVCQNGTATWTPGDVKVVRECNTGNRACRGISSIASTKEYSFMMPTIIIGNKAWMAQNPRFVEGLLTAAWEGGEMVRSSDAALTKAADIQARVTKEEDGAYWKKYAKGVTEHGVPLGGSTTIGLADNIHLFGIGGGRNIYRDVYNLFGSMDVKYYPNEMPKLQPYAEVVNTKYVEAVMSKARNVAAADLPVYKDAARGEVIATRGVTIEFESGKATFTRTAARQMDELLNQLAVSGMSVQINGHTDSVGSQELNIALSKARADAVASFITTNAPNAFPDKRLATRGYGPTQPIAENTTAAGRAKNRRVEIILRAQQ